MRTVNKLTPARVSELIAAGKPGKFPDGNNLYLQVSRYDTASWLFRYMISGAGHWYGLGSVRDFTLKEARERARKCRQMVADGIDPVAQRQADRDARRTDAAARITFKDAAAQYIETHKPGWTNAKHSQQWANTLRDYAYPALGARPVAAITPALVSEALAPIWQIKAVTAKRVKTRIEKICKWVAEGKPLPALPRVVEHHAALPYIEMGDFMGRLRTCDGVVARALEFLVLNAARTGAVRYATWNEIDLAKGVWTVPAGRQGAKTLGKTRRNPLQGRALDILRALPREEGNPQVFIGARAGEALDKDAMREFLKDLGYTPDRATVHGFRSSFGDWAEEATNYDSVVSEAQLWHAKADKVAAAYKRGDLFEKRRRLLREWEHLCMSPPAAKGGTVVPLHGAA